MPLPNKMSPLAWRQPLTFTAAQANSSVRLNVNGSLTLAGIQYKVGRGIWLPYTIGTQIILTNVGDYVQFQNTQSTLSASDSNYARFVLAGGIYASGSIQSLLNYSNSCPDWCFYTLFMFCHALLTCPAMPAASLGLCCYRDMYAFCYGLTTMPSLSAKTLAPNCYQSMFRNTPNLVNVTDLPAVTVTSNCYSNMFAGSGITRSPKIYAATLESNSCYHMFYGCEALNSIEVAFRVWDTHFNLDSFTKDWVAGVASSGTFVKPLSLPEEFGTSRIPENWTVINQ